MKIKRPNSRYFMLELIINSLFFILAAAVCLNLFAYGFSQSDESRDLSQASMKAQQAAEVIKATGDDKQTMAELLGGTITADGCVVTYNNDWQVEQEGEFLLNIATTVDELDILRAQISVSSQDGQIFELDVVRFVGDYKEG